MYIPNFSKIKDYSEAIEFIRRFSFGTIITTKNNKPIATHLPFFVTGSNNLILSSHFSRANEQWKELNNGEVLVIFNEPHGYISSKNYAKQLNVATWDYVAVHAYGQGQIISNFEDVKRVLENSIKFYDEEYQNQWIQLPEEDKVEMVKGIFAFEITVTELQGSKKIK